MPDRTLTKVEQARRILKELGLPSAQCNEISACTLLALCGIGPNSPWRTATRTSLTITKGIMAFVEREYARRYAPNTRETFRRQVLHQFVQACLADYNPDTPSLSTNSPRAHYAVSEAALHAVRVFGSRRWKSACVEFHSQHGSLAELYRAERKSTLVPVRLADGRSLSLSPGKHNEVQAAVVEQFAPRFAPNAVLLYLGDTTNKNLYIDEPGLARLGVPLSQHGKLPDIVLFDGRRDWLFLVEAVTSHGPMTPKRVVELKRIFETAAAGVVYVSAFPDFSELGRHLRQIAWETEIWIAAIPDHMIHYNGDRFLGPR